MPRLGSVKCNIAITTGSPDAALPMRDATANAHQYFNRIDANHDGQIDQSELAAWRDKQRAFYHRDGGARQPVEAASP